MNEPQICLCQHSRSHGVHRHQYMLSASLHALKHRSLPICSGGGSSLVERCLEGSIPDSASLTDAIAQAQGTLGLIHHKEQGAVHPAGEVAGKQLLCSLEGVSCLWIGLLAFPPQEVNPGKQHLLTLRYQHWREASYTESPGLAEGPLSMDTMRLLRRIVGAFVNVLNTRKAQRPVCNRLQTAAQPAVRCHTVAYAPRQKVRSSPGPSVRCRTAELIDTPLCFYRSKQNRSPPADDSNCKLLGLKVMHQRQYFDMSGLSRWA